MMHMQTRLLSPSTLSLLLPLIAVACLASENTHSGFRVGVAAADITPVLGTPMAGYYHSRGADGVLDPLFSKALIVESGNERIALVALDLIGVTRDVTDRAREEVERATGISGSHLMISATHAHTGPELAGRGKRVENLGESSRLTLEYTAKLPALIAQSVRLASESMRPARLNVARGKCEGLAFNRRYFMRDGSVGWNPGRLNPNIVMPAGPDDPELSLLTFEAPDANSPLTTFATYVNFAMHPDTTGGTKCSADWPGALSRVLAGYHGPNHVTLLANGTCGNINHCDFSWQWLSSGPHEQHRIGTILGAAVFQSYKYLRPVPAVALRTRTTWVELALPEVTPTDVEAARKTLAETLDDRGGNFMKLVRSYRVLDVAARAGKPHRVEVQAFALGREIAWISLPGEVFVELGLAIKKRSPFKHTFVVELANENIGYIPDRRSYAEGNYEPESARCAPGSGEKLANAAAESLKSLYTEMPESPPAL